MKLLQLSPDEEGLITAPYIVRFLGAKLIKGVPAVWCVQENVQKQGITMKIWVKANDETVDIELLQHYVTSLANDEVTYHLFEEVPKIKAPQSNILRG